MKYTTNYNLKKPEGTDTVNIDDLNDNADILDNNINSLSKQINNLGAYAVASGTNAYTATIAGITALAEGFSIKIKFTNANTGASTLNINSLGAKSILKGNGSALSSRNIKAEQICNLVYNGSNFQLLGEGGEYGTATALDVLAGKTIGTDAGIIEGTIPIKEATTITPGTVAQAIAAGQYLKGIQTISGDADLVPANIKSGANIFGVAGSTNVINTTTSEAAVASQVLTGRNYFVNGSTFWGTMPNQGTLINTITTQGGSYTIPAGYHAGDGKVTANISNLIASNIKKDANVGGVVGTVETTPESIVIEAVNNRSYYIEYEWVNFIGFGTVGAVKSFKYYKDPITGTWPAITFYIRGESWHLQDSATFTLNGVAKKYYDIGRIEGRYGTYELSAFVPNNTIINGDVIRVTFPSM